MDFSYIDTHGHLNDKAFDIDREEIIAGLAREKIATTIVGTDIAMNKKAIELANVNEGRYAIIGQHPYDEHFEDFDLAAYAAWAALPEVVAIGECGLDYFWPASDGWKTGELAEKTRQHELFLKHIDIAQKANKPLVIHGRPTKGTMDAYAEILAILEDKAARGGTALRGVAHFFAGDLNIAKRFLNLGFNCSFTGVLTFVNDYDEIVRYMPKDRLMAETDAPYVAPKPYRGKRNEPKYVKEVYAAIARIRDEDPESSRIQLNNNAREFFTLPK